jgi:hypothetical protein
MLYYYGTEKKKRAEEVVARSSLPLCVLHVPCNPPLDAAYILLLLFSFIGKNHRKKERDLWPLISEPIF